jgi:hypothetical protein
MDITPKNIPQPQPVSAITTDYTKTTTPVNVPNNTSNTASSSLGSSLAAFGASLQGLSDNLSKQAATPAASGSLSDTLSQYLTLNNKLGSKGDFINQANDAAGVPDKTQQVQDLTNQYNARSRYYDNLITSAQKNNAEGKSALGIQQDVDQLTRQKNAELADIAIQQSAASGNLKVAQDLVQQKVDAEFEPIQQQIDNMKSYYQLAQNDLSESEKLKAQQAIQERQSQLDEEKQKRLMDYQQQIKVNDPKYQADLAGGVGGSGFQGQPGYSSLNTSQKGKADALNNLIGYLNQYKQSYDQLVGSSGVKLAGTDAALLKSQFNALMFAAAQAEGTGALQAADREVLEKVIPNPTSITGAAGTLLSGGKGGGSKVIDGQIAKYTANLANYNLQPVNNYASTDTPSPLPDTQQLYGPDGSLYNVPNDQVDAFIAAGGHK